MLKKITPYFLACFVFVGCTSTQKEPLNTIENVNKRLAHAQAGDTILIASGNYKDAIVHFHANGTAEKPVVLQVENPEETSFSGQSKIYISGSYGVVSGLVFTDGYSPKDAVISFADENHENVATHVRVTNCAIKNYSAPNRLTKDNWVQMAGRENRFDHNYIGGKMNLGTTMVVDLDDEISINNRNSIDSNYFAPKTRMGSNGGETFRMGSSANSLKESNATLAYNYFDRCNGEVEIASIKSSNNTINGNVFFESEGVLALRHGNNNHVYNNYFIGNNKPATGGIRVINAGHTIEKNYLSGLTGTRFYAALPVMNGVPNSPINRYHQVDGVKITENTFINCTQIAFGIGSDNERTATPINTTFANNVIYQDNKDIQLEFLDDVSGIAFKDNLLSAEFEDGIDGFSVANLALEKSTENLHAVVGFPTPKLPIAKMQTGPKWLDKNSWISVEENTGKSYDLTTDNAAELATMVANLKKGDTLWVAEGTYPVEKPMLLSQDVYILSKTENAFPVFEPGSELGKSGIFEITNGAHVYLQGISVSGRSAKGDAAHAVKAIAPMLAHYYLSVNNCRFANFNENNYSAIYAEKGTFADSIHIRKSWFKDMSGAGVELTSENDDRGRYNAEFIVVDDCVFANLMGSAINIYRGGNDESTMGPFADITNCTFINVCNRELGTVVRMIGVQNSSIYNCNFVESGKSGRSILFEDPAWANIKIYDCNLDHAGRIQTFYNTRVNRESITSSSDEISQEGISAWSLGAKL